MSTSIYRRIESGAIFLFLLILYHNFGLSWVTFFIFILAPDIFMLGYLLNAKVGATLYNIGHMYLMPVLLIILAMATDSQLAATLAAIWAMHIAADRALGYGLKLPKGFKFTDLKKL